MNESLTQLLSKKYKKIIQPELHFIVSPQYVINLRNKLNMSQVTFAHLMGVYMEEVELWEDGLTSIPEIAAKLMYLLNENEGLSEQLYRIVESEI